MKNPSRTADAFLDAGEQVGGVTVRPVTLALAAILEKIDSPLVKSKLNATMSDIVQTCFVMTHPASASLDAIRAGRLEEASLEWSDKLAVESMQKIIEAVRRSVLRVSGVSSGAGEGDEKKPAGETAGSPQ